MEERGVDRVRRPRKELRTERRNRQQEERDRFRAYSLVHEQFRRPSPRTVFGKEIGSG